MPTALESKATLERVAAESVAETQRLLGAMSGSPEVVRAGLLETVPGVIDYYAVAAAALAADFYDDERELAAAAGAFRATPVVLDRTVKIRRGVAWAADPLMTDDWDAALARLSEVVQSETVRPYRDTILTSQAADSQAVGWTRITSDGCGFCQMLAANGAVYKEATVRFAAHTNCDCTAAPVFLGGAIGPEASALQYMASGRVRSERERAEIRKWVAFYEGR